MVWKYLIFLLELHTNSTRKRVAGQPCGITRPRPVASGRVNMTRVRDGVGAPGVCHPRASSYRALVVAKIHAVTGANLQSWISAIASSLSAAGSLAALTTAFWAGRAAWKQVKFSAHQQRHRDERDEQEQASMVAAWLAVKKTDAGRPEVLFRYINRSDLPVYDFNITLLDYGPNHGGIYIDVVEPSSEIQEDRLEALTRDFDRIFDQNLAIIRRIDLKGDAEGLAFMNTLSELHSTRILLRFRDTRNVMWQREPHGILGKAPPGTYPVPKVDIPKELKEAVVQVAQDIRRHQKQTPSEG